MEESLKVRSCGRNKAGDPGLVERGRQHLFCGDANKRRVPCSLSDDELWWLILSSTLFQRVDGAGEQLVIDADCRNCDDEAATVALRVQPNRDGRHERTERDLCCKIELRSILFHMCDRLNPDFSIPFWD